MVKFEEDGEEVQLTEGLIDYETNSIYLYQDIDEAVAKEICRAMPKLDAGKRAISMYINSRGGHIPSMVSIITCLANTENDIHVNIMGEACSAAAYIALVGDIRRMSKLSVIMFHNAVITSYGDEKLESIETYVKMTKELTQRTVKEVLKNTKLTYAEFCKKIDKSEWWIFADEAKKLGLIDEIF